MTKYLDAGLDLLDRQIVDVEGEPVGKVDDLELTQSPGGSEWEVATILVGAAAYGRRIGGRLGRWITNLATRMADTREPIRIPLSYVDDIGVVLRLNVTLRDLERPDRLDRWLAEHFIGRIPGAHRASE